MDPMKIITYVAVTAVVALVALGGVGFYAGYTIGVRPEWRSGASESGAGTSQALAQIESLNREIAALKQELAARKQRNQKNVDALAKSGVKLGKMADDLDAAKRQLAEAREQVKTLRARQTPGGETGAQEAQTAATAPQGDEQRIAAAAAPSENDDSVVLYDRFQLEREATRGFDEVDLRFGLQTVGSRSAGLSVNGKRISMQVRDGKQIIHKGVTCELILLDTEREVQRAQFSLACKR